MTYPTLAVKVAFGTSTWYSTPTYTTLPAGDVEALTIDHGKHSMLDGLNPGTCDIRLDNASRNYDRRNAGGAYYPNVTMGRRMQVTATRSGVTYELFNGWTDSWPQGMSSFKLASATMKSSGAFRFLTRAEIPDTYGYEVEADFATAWYRLGDAEALTLTDSATGSPTGPHHGYWQPSFAKLDAVDGLIASTDRAVRLPIVPVMGNAVIPLNQGVITTLRASSFDFWIRMNDVPDSDKTPVLNGWAQLVNGGGFHVWVIGDSSPTYGGVMVFAVRDSSHLNAAWTVSTDGIPRSLADGQIHHVACTIDSAGQNANIWVDGVVSSAPYSTYTDTIDNIAPYGPTLLNDGGGWGGETVVDELAFYDTTLSAARVAAHYEAGLLVGDGDLTGQRIGRVLDLIVWPAALADLDDGQTSLSGSKAYGQMALDYLKLCADTEQGVLSEAHDDAGKVRFQDRNAVLTETRSAVVQTLFSDDTTDIASSSAVVYSAIALPDDDQPVANRVTVKWLGGEVSVEDVSSIGAHGVLPWTISTLLTSRDGATNLANWVLDERGITSSSRVQSITLRPSGLNGTAADRAWTACLERKVGDRVRVKHTPTGSGTQLDHQAWITGIEHRADSGAERWETTFHLTPAILTVYWILGTSQLGTGTRLAY